MNKKKILLLAIAGILLVAAAAFAFIVNANEYYLELNVPQEPITIEYGSDTLPEITGILRGTIINQKGKPIDITPQSEVDVTTLGTYTVTYEAIYKDWPYTIDQVFIVEDTTPPVIELVCDPEHFTSPIAQYEEEGFTATDNYDGDITASVSRKEKDGFVFYTVADSSGNETTVEREIVYKDVVPPVIKLKGTANMYVVVNEKFEEPGFTASDDCDGDITASVTVEGSVDTAKTGTYKLTYKVKDSYNNEATVTRTVQVANKATVSANTGSGGTGEKIVYLTFDDGPGKYTQKLLNTLDKYGVKVTFFVTNQFPSYQHLIGEAHRRGHTIAIHTYSHDYKTIYSSETAYFNDLNKMKDAIIAQTGTAPKIVRFPGGTNNTISKKYCSGIMTALSSSLISKGYTYTDWNVDSNDAGGATSASQVASNVIAGIKKKSVSNVLMHDIKGYTVDAIDQIVSWGLENGYTFKAMTPSSPVFQFRPNN
ncbi:MAG: DUF5011 domain-containing protein [Lachnospiraceae bacterium]|nr:DUF5011 domain-containing protein [Lachnospiraceae bacterium]